MTHISKQALSLEKFNELFEQLNTIVGRLDKRGVSTFFDELLGPEEKIMLAKRLAAIIMCIEDKSIYSIFTHLNISPSTAERIKLNYQIGKYHSIQKLITHNKTEYGRLLSVLETILQAGLPPRGRGRWKRLFDTQ